MTPPPADPSAADDFSGIVLLKGGAEEVSRWVARTVVPLVVAPTQGWTLVVGGDSTEVGAPYDDAAILLAARPVPEKAGPALGFFEIDGRAVITAHVARPGRQGNPRWVVWEPEIGLLRPPGLTLAGPAEIARVAGAAPEVRDELVDLLHETRSRPRTMLQAVMATLSLPGARILGDPRLARDLPGATAKEPAAREVAFFDDAVADSVRLRRELGTLS